jgi:Zn-dependent protease with chaperone function
MQVTHEQIGEGFLFVIVLQLFGLIFLEYARQKFRIASILGKTDGVIGVWPRGASDLSFGIFWVMWMSASFFRDIVSVRDAHIHAPMSLSVKVAIAAMDAAMVLLLAFAIGFRLRMRGLGNFRVSRGKLYAAVSKLSKRSKYLGLEGAPLYVIPDPDFARMCARTSSGVVLPRGLLDILTRSEIDALAARQLCGQSPRSYFRGYWILLGCNAVMVALVQWLNATPLYALLIYLSLLTTEFYALNRLLPNVFFRADLRAIQLTGNAESLFSALGGLSRLTGDPPQEHTLQKIGRETEVSPERIKELLVKHETKPEDRYPTTGSYMDTGL